MSRAAVAAVILVALGLAGCETTATSSQQPGTAVAAGYSEQKIDDSHYRVTFRGDNMNSRTQVETYLLYRAAELAVVNGDDWFEMADRHAHDNAQAGADPARGPGYWRPQWSFFNRPGVQPWGGEHWDPYSVERFGAYQASAVVAMGRGARPAGDTRAFEARQVIETLAPKIVQPL